MEMLKSFTSKDFLYEFEQKYIEHKISYDSESMEIFDKYRKIENIFNKYPIKTNLNEDEITSILLGNAHPVLKKVFKHSGHVISNINLFEKFDENCGETYFSERTECHPFQLFCLSNSYNLKKMKKFEDYYGYNFINNTTLQTLKFHHHFQVGLKKLSVDEVFNSFKPFNSLVMIDPYLLSHSENRLKLVDFLRNILPQRSKSKIFLDLITVQNNDEAFFSNQCLQLQTAIESQKNQFNLLEIELNIHSVPSYVMHDRNYIGNGFIINMGHGLESLKDNKDSDIRMESILEDNALQKIVDKVTLYKKHIKTVGDNPIWKIDN